MAIWLLSRSSPPSDLIVFSASPKIRSASNLGFSPSLLKHDNLVSNSKNSGIILGSKAVIHQDKMLCASVGPNSSRKANFFEVLDAVTVSNTDHFEIQEGDTPTVRQIKGLSQEVTALRKELESTNILIASLKGQELAPEVKVDSGSSWKDKVSPPGETPVRMNLRYFPPDVDGEKVRVSPPEHVDIQGSVKWKNCIVGHFVDKKLPFLVVQSMLSMPGHFSGRLMVLQEWHADMDYEKEGLRKPLYADAMTESSRSYAKICVEVDVMATLPNSVEVLTASGKVVTVRIKYPWRSTKCASCRVFGPNECNKNKVGEIETVKASSVAPNKVWVVKGSKVDYAAGLVSTVLPTPDPMRIAQKSRVPVEVLPCVNQFLALQEDEGVRSSIVVELPIGKSEVDVIQASEFVGDIPESSRSAEQVNGVDYLPTELDVGLSDPDAVFQALSSLEQGSTMKSGGGKNPGAAKKRKKQKKRWPENLDSTVKKCLPNGWSFVHNFASGPVARIIVAWECQNSFGVEELNSTGPWFTWSNKRLGSDHCSGRIDRALVNSQWQIEYTESTAVVLVPGISDHCPLISIFPYRGGRKPFKFFNFWVRHKEFPVLLSQSWSESLKCDSPMFSLYTKLRRLKPVLRQLNKEFYSDKQKRVLEARVELTDIQNRSAYSPSSV
ncbi:hypothetical protein RHSIM_Rhsim04G0075300 [Rhododendron simsii]|uniref:Uncharacterized protein n=1 Tax=Rhododendron simsii TaxID=118357 RepID=A0A834LQD4_RHOSS|nr:hypothetical protein RHSIM_Rhsim04G0075300 [Rhododendron simsii]